LNMSGKNRTLYFHDLSTASVLVKVLVSEL